MKHKRKTKEIRVINVPEEDLQYIHAIALALGLPKQEIYREALNQYCRDHLGLVEKGRAIMQYQAESRKE